LAEIFRQIGNEEGCRRISKAFYALVAQDPVLKPLFPGKSLRCATEEFAAFLIQFFDGDEDQTQYRWFLSLRQSHARFEISEQQRSAWLRLMDKALQSTIRDEIVQAAFGDFFSKSSLYILGLGDELPNDAELKELWEQQLILEQLLCNLASGKDQIATQLAESFAQRRSIFVGILAEMIKTGRHQLIEFTLSSIERDAELRNHCFNGRTLMHFAAGSGNLSVVRKLLSVGADPNVLDAGLHAPLYRASASSSSEAPQIVRELVTAGALVNFSGGVTKSTALHQAARFGNIDVAKTLIELGADVRALDARGLTPHQRAVNCRRPEVARLLASQLQ